MAQTFKEPKSIPSLDVLLNDLKVGTIVRTPGGFNAFSFDEAYRATGGFPRESQSGTGGEGRDHVRRPASRPPVMSAARSLADWQRLVANRIDADPFLGLPQ